MTGLSEERELKKGIHHKKTPAYQMGVEAAMKAMDNAGISAEELDLIIVSTEAPDYLTPSMACSIQAEIGAVNAPLLMLMPRVRDSYTDWPSRSSSLGRLPQVCFSSRL